MRLLWEETGFELVGAFCVAAFSFGAAWIVLESVLGLSGLFAGLLAAAVAAWALEAISRHHYAGRARVVPPLRAAPGASGESRRSVRADAAEPAGAGAAEAGAADRATASKPASVSEGGASPAESRAPRGVAPRTAAARRRAA